MTSLHDIIDSTLQNKDVVMKLLDIGVLRVSGLDSKKFLQGQTTCDMNKLSQDNGLYGAICSIKGRIISSFYIVQNNDDVLMVMAKDLVEKTLLHLKKYAVFFKTVLVDEQDNFTIYTKLAAKNIEANSNAASNIFATTQDRETITLTVSNEPLEVQWLITPAHQTAIEEKNQELAALAVLAARPLINLEQSETILPQWLNMQSTGGISFTKGCYTGQEIVARMQYKGKSKKQLALVTWEGNLDTTKDIVDGPRKSIGQIFAATHFQETNYAQVILNIDPSDAEKLLLDNQEITLLPLPYSLDSKK
ncbi:CAF17-like 4Fe-4S cluster assembly/insertion protein YgfZ [Marinomonas sp. BSi20584]|uniref:CAF17-like 4Fe-4S cluster assembly/insertion protein YgfZ n=1 Tax=Marinomonas sp. BSi20584 TaxID=1594462 RepID=UPI0018E106F2|nr:folate-binding protein YgfZ [Marinomonas sp. BSi20584]